MNFQSQNSKLSGKSNIEWTEITWNPTIGCNKISEGCKNCYAETWAHMQQKRGLKNYSSGFKFRSVRERLNDPYKWNKPKIVFVNSMSDIFHEDIPREYLFDIFQVMNSTPHHIYQLLTKRADQLEKFHLDLLWTDNIWMGVSVESNQWKGRIDILRNTNAKVKFISFEPLLEKMEILNLDKISWVIVGGESGGKARPIKKEWVEGIRRSCETYSIPFFFKQWGKKAFNPDQTDVTTNKNHPEHSRGGCLIDGKLFRELPLN